MTSETETEVEETTAPAKSRRWSVWRVFGLGVAVVIATPLLLTVLYAVVPPVSTLMLADWLTGRQVERQWVSFEEMGTPLVASVIASEDGKFCRHMGIDLGELRASVQEWMDGGRPRGASTITMQLAKNLFLWPQRSEVRKALELPLALWLDLVLSKRRLLEIYLNVAEWAPGVYGAGAGTAHYYTARPDQLSWRNAALMATTLPNPKARNPARPSSRHARIAGIVEGRARQGGASIACLGL
ncbi:MAG: transglycosylase domain-containing protein [Pseudomonadota bacterium]